MALGTALFTGHGVHFLPRTPVRFGSPGFISIAAVFVMAGFFRHSLVHGLPPVTVAVSLALYCIVLLLLFGQLVRADRMALAMCASAGVDLVIGAATFIGVVDGAHRAVAVLGEFWVFVAALWAIKGRNESTREGFPT